MDKKADIINLHDDNKIPKIRYFERVKEYVNNKTGEVEETVSSFVQKADTQDNFVKLFLSNMNFLVESLNHLEMKVLFYCIQKINYRNVFQYNSTEFVNYHVHKNIMSKASFYRSFNHLKELKVFLPIEKQEHLDALDLFGKNYFLINPNLVGKGSFRDIKEIRQMTVKVFDFDKLEMKEDISTDYVYDGFNNVLKNPDKYKIESINEIKSNNRTETEFVIAEKDEIEKEIDCEPKLNNNTKDNKENFVRLEREYELAIMKEKNKEKELDNTKKELEIREKELENEKMKLEIKLNEQKKSKSERTLFDD